MPLVMGVLLISILICFPLWLIFSEFLNSPTEGWEQISQRDPGGMLSRLGLEGEIPEHSKLFERTRTTLIVLTGVGGLSLLIGVFLAWIVSMWDFPFRKILSCALVLPLAIPSYIFATAYKLLTVDYKNQFCVYIKENYGLRQMQDFDAVWNHLLAILVLSLAFYPYVYVAARTAFTTLSKAYIESARILGESAFKAFLRVALRLARPAIVGGMLLVLLETLNEFGAMQILGINTLTTEIFYAWTNLGDMNAAIRLAGCIMLIVFVLLMLEVILRGGRRYFASRSSGSEYEGHVTNKFRASYCIIICSFVILLGFILPCYKIVSLALGALPTTSILYFSSEIVSSLWLAGKAALLIIAVSLFLAYAHRLMPHWFMLVLVKFCNLGYAIPGAILGVTLITWSGVLTNSDIDYVIVEYLFYSSSIGILLAYMIRFLVVGLHPIEAGLKNIHHSLDEASRLMGVNRYTTFFKIHLPILKHAISGGVLILFIDILKELPLTLIMNHETLATRTYSLFAKEERYDVGAIPALILILVGVAGITLIRLYYRNLKN